LLKVSRDTFTPRLTRLLNKIWESEEIPEDWKIGVIIPLLKKGDASDCTNYRGITVLSVVGKIFTGILLARINTHLQSQWNKTQSGFRPNRSTIDNIFIIRQMVEKSAELNLPCAMAFVDFQQAFDSVNHESHWRLLAHYKISQKLIDLLKAMHSVSRAKPPPKPVFCWRGHF